MPTYGPWVQPDDQTATLLVLVTHCDLAFDASALSSVPATMTAIANRVDADAYMMMATAPDDADTDPIFPPLAPGVDHYEAEVPHGVVLSVTASGAISAQGIDTAVAGEEFAVRGDLRRVTTYDLVIPGGFSVPWAFPPGSGPLAPGTLSGWPLLEQFYGTDTSTPFVPFGETWTVDELDAGRRIVLAVDPGHYADGTSPAMASSQSESVALTSLSITYTWRPPRYRAVYVRTPPLRQFPRDDGLTGTSAPRQRASTPSSLQAGLRQRPAGYL